MFTPQRTHIFLAVCIAFGLLATPARASLTAIIMTDTTSIQGGSGFIDLQFNAISGSLYAIATVSNFSTNGILGGCGGGCYMGVATGDLGSSVAIKNGISTSTTSSYNYYNEPMIFGTYTQIYVTPSG